MTGQYSIGDMEALSGIRAHTIRIWEQRYHLFQPARTETNIRYYSDADLKKLLNVTTLQRYGWKISKLGKLSTDELNLELRKQISTNAYQDDFIEDSINELIKAAIGLDEMSFSDVFKTCTENIGLLKTMGKVIFPVLNRIGSLWSTSDILPAQEHFLSNLVKMKLAAAIDTLPAGGTQSKKIILFTPENELHDIGLMLTNFILRSKGFETIYLGQSVPYNNLQQTASITGANSIYFSLTVVIDKEKVLNYLNKISANTSFENKYFSAKESFVDGMKIPPNLTWIKNPVELDIHF
jgi:DNA-binding transcriptional MerR regulator